MNQNRFGMVNQRAAISVWANGVQMLTMPITASSTKANGRARSCICSCNLPSVFMISQVQPSKAYATTSAAPQNIVNGVSQSSEPPANCRLTTGSPSMNAPSATPWKNVAVTEPPMNALSHRWRLSSLALKRNSKATPRKINPINIRISGRYNAESTTE
ncbi:hypothetical protein D3C85_790620 [compost metagenome]